MESLGPETAEFGTWIYLLKEYFVRRKRNHFSKAAIPGAQKSVHPSWVKGRRVILPSIEKKKEAPLSQKDTAALTIQTPWLSHMDKRIFYLLKHTICVAEYCVAREIPKNVSPVEAELVKDGSMKCKIRFRLSGETFLPFIVFTIVIPTGGQGYKYFSGKNMVSTDACKLMGKKKFHEQIMEDEHLSLGVQNN